MKSSAFAVMVASAAIVSSALVAPPAANALPCYGFFGFNTCNVPGGGQGGLGGGFGHMPGLGGGGMPGLPAAPPIAAPPMPVAPPVMAPPPIAAPVIAAPPPVIAPPVAPPPMPVVAAPPVAPPVIAPPPVEAAAPVIAPPAVPVAAPPAVVPPSPENAISPALRDGISQALTNGAPPPAAAPPPNLAQQDVPRLLENLPGNTAPPPGAAPAPVTPPPGAAPLAAPGPNGSINQSTQPEAQQICNITGACNGMTQGAPANLPPATSQPGGIPQNAAVPEATRAACALGAIEACVAEAAPQAGQMPPAPTQNPATLPPQMAAPPAPEPAATPAGAPASPPASAPVPGLNPGSDGQYGDSANPHSICLGEGTCPQFAPGGSQAGGAAPVSAAPPPLPPAGSPNTEGQVGGETLAGYPVPPLAAGQTLESNGFINGVNPGTAVPPGYSMTCDYGSPAGGCMFSPNLPANPTFGAAPPAATPNSVPDFPGVNGPTPAVGVNPPYQPPLADVGIPDQECAMGQCVLLPPNATPQDGLFPVPPPAGDPGAAPPPADVNNDNGQQCLQSSVTSTTSTRVVLIDCAIPAYVPCPPNCGSDNGPRTPEEQGVAPTEVKQPDGTTQTMTLNEAKKQATQQPDGTWVANPPPASPSWPNRVNSGLCNAMHYTGNMALPPSCPAP